MQVGDGVRGEGVREGAWGVDERQCEREYLLQTYYTDGWRNAEALVNKYDRAL